MEPEMWNQAEDLFGRGLEASADEREHLLANAPPDIAAAVRDLWRQHAEAGSFLQHPAAVQECPRQFADGQILGGRFKIVGFIGAGGMGEVYRAHDERLGRTVAIKALHARLTADADSRSRFEREARAVCSLNHPRICSLHDVAWDGSTPLLVMEHLSGETLAERLTRGRLTLDELLAVGEGIADALAYAHQHGVVHRDLKPGNIMLTEHGPKLLDFGIAKRVIPQGVRADTATTVTQTAAGMIVGSVAYMSPEQAESRLTDHRADVF
ncbi:MAG: serine/threonine-protein kinase, partial [Bryobacteraceae bacterium]